MNKWFECRIRYEKTMEDGMQKKVTELYIVDSMSFTETETRIIEEMQPLITGEFEVTAIKRAAYAEVIHTDNTEADRWYAVRLQFITLDERTGIEKKTKSDYLLQAADIEDARRHMNEAMKQSMADYEIVSIKETTIMDVFPYQCGEAQ